MASTLQQDVTAIQLADHAPLVIIIAVGYDYILTFPDEIDYIWNKSWTGVSTLYILARYSGLCFILINSLVGTSFVPGPVKACKFIYSMFPIFAILKDIFQGEILNSSMFWIFTIFIGAADLAMILRVWVLYKESTFRTFIHRALLILYVIQIVIRLVNCVILSTNVLASAITQAQLLGFSFCLFQVSSPLAVWAGVASDIVQIALGGSMSLLVGVQFIRQSLQMYRATGKRFELGHYISLLVRDGLFYFLAILSFALFDLLSYVPSTQSDELWWWNMLSPILQFVPTFALAPRLILTLRKLYARIPSRPRSGTSTPAPFTSMFSDRDEGGTFMFASAGQEEGSEQDGGIQMVEREIPIPGPSRV